MKMIMSVLDGIDRLNEWIGRIFSFLLFPLLTVSFYEVVARYVFNRPTIWAAQILSILFVTLVVLGGGHVLRHDGHIRMDVLYSRWSHRARAISDISTFLVFLLFTGLLAWQALDMAWTSVSIKETSWTAFKGPIYPKKIALALGAILLTLQGIVKLRGDIRFITRERLERNDNEH